MNSALIMFLKAFGSELERRAGLRDVEVRHGYEPSEVLQAKIVGSVLRELGGAVAAAMKATVLA